jgi:hypothetical protein
MVAGHVELLASLFFCDDGWIILKGIPGRISSTRCYLGSGTASANSFSVV